MPGLLGAPEAGLGSGALARQVYPRGYDAATAVGVQMTFTPIAQHSSAQVTFGRTSTIARDNVVNVFHVRRPSGASHADFTSTLSTACINFYNTTPTAMANRLALYLSLTLSNATNAASVKTYDLGAAEPHVPTTTLWTLARAASGGNLPDEVALCLSYKADATAGVPLARSRGRIYLGPLNQDAMATGESGGDARPSTGTSTGIVQVALAAAHDFYTAMNSVGAKWVVYSPTSGSLHDITSAWIDNAFDTQRRRGGAATVRTVTTF